MIKDLFKDLVKYLPSYIIPAVVGIIAIPIITRLFPPEDYGDYVLVLITISVLSTISTVWIDAAIIRFFPAYKLNNRLTEFYNTIIKLAFISVVGISFIFSNVLFLAKGCISAHLYSLMHIGLLTFLASSWLTVLLAFLRAKRQVGLYTSFAIWRSVAGLGFGVVLIIVFHYGVEGLLWGALLSAIIALPLLWRITVRTISLSFKKFYIRSPMSVKITKYGFPLIAVNIAGWVLSLSDRYVLKIFRGSQEVGIYSIGYGISEQTIRIILMLFAIASGPIAFNIWENKGVEASRGFLEKVTRYYLLIALPATVGLSVLAKPVVGVLASPAYLAGYIIVPLVAFSAFFTGIERQFGIILNYYKRTDLTMYYNLIGAALNLGLNLLLIPKYGYIAAAATTFIACIANLVMIIAISRHFLVWQFPFKSFGKIASASGVMGIIVYHLSSNLTSSNLVNLILGIIVGVVVYSLMLFLLCEFKPSEIQALLDLKRHFFHNKENIS